MTQFAHPRSSVGWLATGLQALNHDRKEAAVQDLRREICQNGPHLELYRALATCWLSLGRPARAMEALLQAIVLAPDDLDLRRQLQSLCPVSTANTFPTRAQWSRVTDDLNPRGPYGGLTAEFAVSQACLLQKAGRLGPALEWCFKAIVLEPDDHLHAARAADLLLRQGRLADGRRLLVRANEANPSAMAYQQIGRLAEELHDFPNAMLAYQRALALEGDNVSALCAIGHLLQDQGKVDDASPYLLRALELKPDPLVHVLEQSSIPPIHSSCEDMIRRRKQLEERLERLVSENVVVDPSERIVPTTFYTAYQGLNERPIAERYGRIYKTKEIPPPTLRAGWGSRKLRVGFLSKFFCRHTIGRLNIGTVSHLSRERFEVVVISARKPDDPMAHEFAGAADRYVLLADQPAPALEQLRGLDLDILFYPDVGMDPLTYSLAFARAAPIQCVTWGHPITTGSPNMDYFISSERLEIPEAQEHYTERLVRLPDLAVFYPRPRPPADLASRKRFGFSENDHLYGCPQTLFKLHPEFDEILAQILSNDPFGRLVLIEGRHADWTDQLRRRLEQRLGAAIERVHFLPRLSWPDFMAVSQFVNVLLDPIHFGGGNTTYEALALGTPVVSQPGSFLRSRITLALYERMGFRDCLAYSAEAYVELALRLGTDSDFRLHASRKILDKCHVLYDDLSGIRQLERFWEQVVERAERDLSIARPMEF